MGEKDTEKMIPPLVHKQALIRARVNKSPLADYDLDTSLRALIRLIDMNILSGPHCAWCPMDGNVGWSGTAIIETSHIAFHSWCENGTIQLDVYSCKNFDINTVLGWLQQFDPIEVDYKFLDRENGFEHIEDNRVDYKTINGIYI